MILARPWGLIVAALLGSGSLSLPIWAWVILGVVGICIFYFALKCSSEIEDKLFTFVRKVTKRK